MTGGASQSRCIRSLHKPRSRHHPWAASSGLATLLQPQCAAAGGSRRHSVALVPHFPRVRWRLMALGGTAWHLPHGPLTAVTPVRILTATRAFRQCLQTGLRVRTVRRCKRPANISGRAALPQTVRPSSRTTPCGLDGWRPLGPLSPHIGVPTPVSDLDVIVSSPVIA
jgi:hypothetical protein